MSKNKSFFAFSLVSIILSIIIIYSSCTKNPCSGVNCLNGGACSSGNCICPTGYVGSRCQNLATTIITYENNTYTTVALSIGGNSYSIPSGQTQSFSGTWGDVLSASWRTTGTSLGLVLSSSVDAYFPSSGINYVPIDISSNYFFLYIDNSSSSSVTDVFVNFQDGTIAEHDVVNLTPGVKWAMGYYEASVLTGIKAINASYTYTVYPFTSLTTNQSYTMPVN